MPDFEHKSFPGAEQERANMYHVQITYKFVVLSIIIVNQLYYCDRLYGLMKIAVQEEIKETETEATCP